MLAWKKKQFFSHFILLWFFLSFFVYTLNKTPLEEIECLSKPYFFNFFNPYLLFLKHSIFWFTLFFWAQSVRSPLAPHHSQCSIFVTYGTPCCSIGHQVLPTQSLPREAEDFSRGSKYPKHVPLPAHLDYL